MKSNTPKNKRKIISRKKFEEKIIAEQNFSDKGINLEDDPYRNSPEYYEEEGITSLKTNEENEQVKKEN